MKLDQRKHNSASTRAKKSASGKKSKAGGVFAPAVRNKTREDKLQEQIEKVVQMARKSGSIRAQNGEDVMMRYSRVRLTGKGYKLG